MSEGWRAELLAAHRAAVAAQDEQRHVEPGLGERLGDHRRRPLDDRQDRSRSSAALTVRVSRP